MSELYNLMQVHTQSTAPKPIQTYSRQYVDLLKPDPNCVRLTDIPHALSLKHRFGGHTRTGYSVAQHCVLGAREFRSEGRFAEGLAFLLHECGEVYLPDIPSPLKPHLMVVADGKAITWLQLEQVHTEALLASAGLPWLGPIINSEPIKHMDKALLMTEAAQCLPGGCLPGWGYPDIDRLDILVELWTPAEAERAWFSEYQTLLAELPSDAELTKGVFK